MIVNATDLSRRRAIAEAVALVMRVECGEEDAEVVADLLALLERWKSGTVHGHPPVVTKFDPKESTQIKYG